jgi:dTDP-4-amino-4,6-dideoxygalactose transaminase
LKLIFDAAHAIGAKYNGNLVGGFGDAEVFSLSPTKILTAGEGGIVATNDDVLAGNIRIGRDYANPGDYNCQFAGLSARMAEFNAILGLKNLETIEEKVARRNGIADVYKENLKGLPGISFQEAAPGSRCSYKDVSILIDPKKFGLTRDVLADCLVKENIMTKKYYYPPIHKQRFITSMFKADESKLKVTNYVSGNILSLPIFTHMKDKDIAAICGAISNIYKHPSQI